MESLDLPYFSFFVRFAGVAEHKPLVPGVLQVRMTFDKTECRNCVLIEPGKCQRETTQSSTRLGPKRGIKTGMYVEEQTL